MCHKCEKAGHLAKNCTSKKGTSNDEDSGNPRWALTSLVVGELTSDDWIANTGASAHMVRDKSMLYDWEEVHDDVATTLPDGSKMKVTRQGTARLRVRGDGESYWITLKDACYSPKLALDLVSLGTLMDKTKAGCVIGTWKGRMVMYLQVKNNVVVSAMEDSVAPAQSVQKGTLMGYHLRFGHLNFDYIEKLASNPANGIELTDQMRKNCLTCAEGK
jgi:hypothetical protein